MYMQAKKLFAGDVFIYMCYFYYIFITYSTRTTILIIIFIMSQTMRTFAGD